MKMRWAASAGAIVAAIAAVPAGAVSVLTQNVTFAGTADLNNQRGVTTNAAALPFFFFDTRVGTLDSIEFSSSYGFATTGVVGTTSGQSGSIQTRSAARFTSDDADVTAALTRAVDTIGGYAYNLVGTSTSYTNSSAITITPFTSVANASNRFTVTDASILAAFSRVGTFSYNPLLTTLTSISTTSPTAPISQTTAVNGSLTIVYNITPFATPTPTPVDAVPEAGTWAMMILGVAAMGLLLRRRRHGVAPRIRPVRA